MTLQQLRYFVAVADCGAFTRAATRCDVAQPSLSQQIARLEESLGMRLFDRIGRGATLTDAGRALLPRAREILAHVRDVEAHLEADLDRGVGALAVGAIPTMAPYLLPCAIEAFGRRFPECDLTVREDLTERLVDALIDGNLDLAMMSAPIDNDLVELDVIAHEPLLLAAPAGHDLARSGSATSADLRDAPVILLHEMHCLGQQMAEFCAVKRVARRIVCTSAQLATVQSLVALGMGVSLVPKMCADADTSKERAYLPFVRGGPSRPIAIAWRKDRSRSRVAQGFAELLRAQLG